MIKKLFEVQKYLKNGKTLKNLEEEFAIKYKWHPNLPIFILDYTIDSPKTHPITIECRSLVLDENFDIVSVSFRRFFNYGEALDITKEFNWDDFSSWEKLDGSYIAIFSYKGELVIRTRFSWADSDCGLSNRTWGLLVVSCLTEDQINMICKNDNLTLVFELTSPWNQVVKYYPNTDITLLTVIYNDGRELGQTGVNFIAREFGFKRPQEFNFKSIDECIEYLDNMNAEKTTDEGFVLLDDNRLRLKIKNKYYLLLHSLNGNDELTSFKKLVPVCLNGEIDEIVAYFPHLKDIVEETKFKLSDSYKVLKNWWIQSRDIEDRKTFAISIKDCRFSGILFSLKNQLGCNSVEADLWREWLKSEKLIIKVLFD